jgi:hypothetical protein
MKTTEELIEYITSNKLIYSIFNDGDNEDDNEELYNKYNELALKYDVIDYTCNSDELYMILYFKEIDIYLKLTGEYDSYGEGQHYYNDEVKQVYPEQKTIIVYKSKK